MNINKIRRELNSCTSENEITDVLVSFCTIPLDDTNEHFTLIEHITTDKDEQEIIERLVRKHQKHLRALPGFRGTEWIDVMLTKGTAGLMSKLPINEQQKLWSMGRMIYLTALALEYHHLHGTNEVSSIEKSMVSKLEALGYKNYCTFVNKINKKLKK